MARRIWRGATIGMVAVVAIAVSGCSVALMKTAPSASDDVSQVPDCTSAYTMPLIDAVLAVLTGATAVNLHSAAGNPKNDGTNFRAFAWSATGVAVGFLGSATYGAVQRNRCVRAKVTSGYRRPRRPSTNRRLPGTLGGRCRRDGSCDGELVCDVPMRTCIPINPTDETLPPPQP